MNFTLGLIPVFDLGLIPFPPNGPRRATRSIFFAFSIFVSCKLTLGSPFAIFEPWIRRRLGPVPACLILSKLRRESSNYRVMFLDPMENDPMTP